MPHICILQLLITFTGRPLEFEKDSMRNSSPKGLFGQITAKAAASFRQEHTRLRFARSKPWKYVSLEAFDSLLVSLCPVRLRRLLRYSPDHLFHVSRQKL